MAIVWLCRLDVTTYASAGQGVEVPRPDCPACARPMSFSSGYKRYVRHEGSSTRIWIRRARCGPCRASHAVIPSFSLIRRLDPVGVIGTVVAQVVGAGRGVRPVAREAGVPHTTARDWVRRFRARAPLLASGFSTLAVELGSVLPRVGVPGASGALVAMGAAWAAARKRFGSPVPALWPYVGLVVGGAMLATTTRPPWARALGRRLIPPVPEST